MVRLEEHKHRLADKAIEKLPAPGKVYLPLIQHIGKACLPLVNAGDQLALGQKIAAVGASVYAPVHASVSGKVAAIQDWPHPVLGRCKAIVIENDNQDRIENLEFRTEEKIKNLSLEQIRNIVLEAGIVGMGGASFPTHIKLNPPNPVDTLIINGAECESYLTSDYRLMLEKTEEILAGIELVARCLKVKFIYIAIEDNKLKAIEKFRVQSSCLSGRQAEFRVKVLKSAYPQGGEKQLIKNVINKEVPSGKLPFDIGVVVQNVATVFAIYEAVYKNRPLYERVVSVSGSCILNPKNLLVRIGTPIEELINFCGVKEEPEKIIIGGPMMGIAQYTDRVPVIKATNGVLLLNKKEAVLAEEESCIRCGACVRECPAGLMPCLINLASQKWLWQQAKNYGASDCIECGLCDYVCPASRKLVQSIKRAKLEAGK
jgi:electron transport complex protein RnfC